MMVIMIMMMMTMMVMITWVSLMISCLSLSTSSGPAILTKVSAQLQKASSWSVELISQDIHLQQWWNPNILTTRRSLSQAALAISEVTAHLQSQVWDFTWTSSRHNHNHNQPRPLGIPSTAHHHTASHTSLNPYHHWHQNHNCNDPNDDQLAANPRQVNPSAHHQKAGWRRTPGWHSSRSSPFRLRPGPGTQEPPPGQKLRTQEPPILQSVQCIWQFLAINLKKKEFHTAVQSSVQKNVMSVLEEKFSDFSRRKIRLLCKIYDLGREGDKAGAIKRKMRLRRNYVERSEEFVPKFKDHLTHQVTLSITIPIYGGCQTSLHYYRQVI